MGEPKLSDDLESRRGSRSAFIVTIIVNALKALFSIFRKGINKATRKSLEGLRSSMVTTSNSLLQFATRVARAVHRVLFWTVKVWDGVIRPILRYLEKIARTIDRIYNRILRPALETLESMRRSILRIYELFFRPILDVISKIRASLAVLRALRIPFARKLDERLARLEGKIFSPIRIILERINRQATFINVILSKRWIFQPPIFLRSIWLHQGELTRMWWSVQAQPLPPGVRERIRTVPEPLGPAQAVRAFEDLVLRDSGPFVLPTTQARARFDEIVAGGR